MSGDMIDKRVCVRVVIHSGTRMCLFLDEHYFITVF